MKCCLVLCILAVCPGVLSFQICSFNAKCLGPSKAAKSRVMGIIVKIVSRCDICLIMEVRDTKGKVTESLVEELNRFDRTHKYSYIASKRLGHSHYKEQYVFVYRSDSVMIIDSYQYEDNKNGNPDVFARGPFSTWFHSPRTAIKDFVLIGLHTAPDSAAQEMEELYKVFLEVRKKWGIEDVMLLGDLNAGRSYVSHSDWETIRLRTDPSFHWLIGDEEDTTISKSTHCAYDRMIAHGSKFHSTIVPGSAKAFHFQVEFGLSEDEAGAVSEHYPVEVEIKVERDTHSEL
ncbi:deoxyribonuclease gamma-like [Stegostoma tigrinum]|uniref:deoxyribonuclease gamma-like n=1 Tax=Stegostoma tigrinum TaxID=3053191 RepID=UPI00287059FA|nr:deoxyribonuclease gamma-like [Stegostoma tigrinum]